MIISTCQFHDFIELLSLEMKVHNLSCYERVFLAHQNYLQNVRESTLKFLESTESDRAHIIFHPQPLYPIIDIRSFGQM